MKMTLAIQAGGDSRRMGQDKGLVPLLGQPLVARAIQRLGRLADEVLVTTNHTEAYRFLGIPLFPDLIPGVGALSGLYTALSAAQNPLVAVVACDMPFASADLLSYARDRLLAANA
ncbi:MAG TPA: molybdenum cofactor guanylyltransferase, partial [Anaerolineales bacterium]|nr:molybdenum cofactor guanylyltransferase [Anaerolineales bacterium]